MTETTPAPSPARAPALKQRLKRIAPYFRSSVGGLILVVIGALVGSATEPMIPALMKPLFDSGFKAGSLPLWLVPIAVIGLFAVRGLAGFVAQYGLAWGRQPRRAGDAPSDVRAPARCKPPPLHPADRER